MKTGLTLEQLAAEITRQQSAKEDYVVNTGNLRLESYGPDLTLRVLDNDGADRIEPLEIGDIAHRQIGTHLSIPAKYYERMRSEDPGLLAHNVNTWLERTPAQRMIRVLDGKARAYLSNRYLRMDNYSIASAVLPILAEIPDVRIESCQITDSRMYIKAVNPRLQEDVTPGDTVQAGVVISNSEVGLGSVNIQPLIYRLVCSNGKVEDLQPEQVGEFRAFVESFRQQAKEMLKNRAELSAAREGEEDQYATANTEYAVADSGQHFCISGVDVIDGEREELPR